MTRARPVVVLLCLLLSGCGVFRRSPVPPPVMATSVVYTLDEWKHDRIAYEWALFDHDITKATFFRNKMLWSSVNDVNRSYFAFRNGFAGARAAARITSDVLQLGMTAAATVLGGSAILSAATVALQGGSLSADQNLFKEQATESIFTTLDALREEQMTVIQRKLLLPPPDYGFEEAFGDALTLYNCGSVASGLQRMMATAAAQQQDAANRTTEAVKARVDVEAVQLPPAPTAAP